MSHYLEGLIADWLQGTPFPTAPASLRLALSTTAIGKDASGLLEPAAGSYARQPIALALPTTTSTTTRTVSSADIAFPVAATDWSAVAHVGIYTVGGDLLTYSPLANQRRAMTGDQISFLAGQVQVTFGTIFSNWFATQIINWMRGNTMVSPGALALALSTADLDATGSSLTEILTGVGYARQTVTFAEPDVTENGTSLATDTALVFGPASANWAQIVSGALMRGSNMVFYGPVAAPKTVASGDSFALPAGALSFQVQ